MLSRYMQSEEYTRDIEAVVDVNLEFKVKEKECLDLLESFNLDRKTYDSFDFAVTFMMIAARDLAYRKGFHDGVALVSSCVSSGSGKSDPDFGKAWKHIEVKEAWDRKAKIHNQLVDLLVDKGMDEDTTVSTVDELCDSVEELDYLVVKHGIDKAEFSGKEAAQV